MADYYAHGLICIEDPELEATDRDEEPFDDPATRYEFEVAEWEIEEEYRSMRADDDRGVTHDRAATGRADRG